MTSRENKTKGISQSLLPQIGACFSLSSRLRTSCLRNRSKTARTKTATISKKCKILPPYSDHYKLQVDGRGGWEPRQSSTMQKWGMSGNQKPFSSYETLFILATVFGSEKHLGQCDHGRKHCYSSKQYFSMQTEGRLWDFPYLHTTKEGLDEVYGRTI